MTTVRLNILEGTEDELKKILHDAAFKAEFVDGGEIDNLVEPRTQYHKIKKLLDDAKGKNLFKDIADPSEWQRQIRKEWDRDF